MKDHAVAIVQAHANEFGEVARPSLGGFEACPCITAEDRRRSKPNVCWISAVTQDQTPPSKELLHPGAGKDGGVDGSSGGSRALQGAISAR